MHIQGHLHSETPPIYIHPFPKLFPSNGEVAKKTPGWTGSVTLALLAFLHVVSVVKSISWNKSGAISFGIGTFSQAAL